MSRPKVRKTETASFDVDAQNTFSENCLGELPVSGALQIVDELNAQAGLARWRVMSKDAHPIGGLWEANMGQPMLADLRGLGRPNMDRAWNQHGVVGTFGFELLAGLPHPQDYDFLVYKGAEKDMHPYGACYHDLAGKTSTGVIEWLQANGVNTVIVGGLALDFCVKLTALQLRAAGLQVILNLAATRAVIPATSPRVVEEMISAGIEIVACARNIECI